jgi:drug/metabolite transporter (DMT)-like permease
MMATPLLYAVTVLIWGSTWFAIRFQLGPVPPDLSVAYRFALAGALLIGYCLLTRRSLRFPMRAHGFIALEALFLFCANYILLYLATSRLTTGLIAVVFSTALPMNVVNGAILLGTPVDRRVLAGGAIGLAGMPLLFWSQIATFDASSGGLIGLGLSIAGTLSASLGNVISARNQSAGLPVVETNALGMSYGAVLTLAFVLFRGDRFTFDASTAYLASLAYLAVFGSIVAFGCYLTLLGRIGADRAAYAMVQFPVIALAISTIFEGYRWTLSGVFGVAFILAGNLIVLRKSRGVAAGRGHLLTAGRPVDS